MSLTALVTFADGSSLLFDQAAGQDLGDFQGPGFVQKCFRCTLSGSPLTVYFRPDADGSRAEVVFELGRMWGAANAAAADMGAYTATISQDGTVLATVNVARHFWFSRWRWQSAPRPVLAQPLCPLGFPPPDASLLKYVPKPKSHAYAGPMDGAGITPAMGEGGDRPDLGILTEYAAYYLATKDPAALATVLAQGEAAAGSIPWAFRDEDTGAPVNLYTAPIVYWTKPGAPQLPNVSAHGTFVRQVNPVATNGVLDRIAWDYEHEPNLCFIPYALTGDPYYMEGLQFQVTAVIGYETSSRLKYKLLTVLSEISTRGMAWALRSLVEAATATPANAPAWLAPQSYWQKVLADNRDWFSVTFVQSTLPQLALFRAAPRADAVEPWMDDYLLLALCHVVELGFDDWRPILEWKAGSRLALSDGKHGWHPQAAAPYQYNVIINPTPFRWDLGTAYASWADAWSAYQAAPPSGHALTPQPCPPEPQLWYDSPYIGQSYGYCYWALAALAWMTRLGVPGAADAYGAHRRFIDYNFSIKNALGKIAPNYNGRYSFAFDPTPRITKAQLDAALGALSAGVRAAEQQAAAALATLGLDPGTVPQDYVAGKITAADVYALYRAG